MATPNLWKDKDFLKLTPPDKQAVMQELDTDFAGLPDREQKQVIFQLTEGTGSERTIDVSGMPTGHTPGEVPKQKKSYFDRIINPTVPNEKPENLRQFLTETLPASATKTVAGAVVAPYQLSKTLVQEGPARLLETLGRGIGEPVGFYGKETMVDRWQTDPVGSGLAVAPVGIAAMKGAGAVKAGASGARTAVQNAVAEKLYDMTLKQGTTLKRDIRKQNVKSGIEGGYLPNNKGVEKLATDIEAAETSIGGRVKAAGESGVRGTLDRARTNIETLREEANRSADPVRNNALIDAELERLNGNPMKAEDGSVNVADLQKMKVEQGRHVKYQQKTGQAVDAFQSTIDKARIRGMKEEIETQLSEAFPEIAAENKKLGGMYKLQDVLDRAANRIENNQGIGIGLPIKSGAGAAIGGAVAGPMGAAVGGGIGTMIGIIEHPAVAPRLAMALYRSSKGKISKGQARSIVRERLTGLVGSLKEKAEGSDMGQRLATQAGKIKDKLKDKKP